MSIDVFIFDVWQSKKLSHKQHTMKKSTLLWCVQKYRILFDKREVCARL